MRPYTTAVLGQEIGPNLNVPVLDLSQPEIEGLLLRVLLFRGEYAVQKGGIRLVLPMMLEGVEVGAGRWDGHGLKTNRIGSRPSALGSRLSAENGKP